MGGPKGINWDSALEYYLTPDSEGRIPSYQDVANKFDVSKSEVGLRAKNENWLQRRRNLYDLAEESFVENRVELINQTVAKHIKTWRRIQDLASRSFAEIFLTNLDKFWIELDLAQRQVLQSQIFPNGIVCQNKIIRTTDLSQSFQLIEALRNNNSDW